MALEQRIGRLEGAYEQVDRRLEDLSRSIDSLRGDMKGLRSEMNSRLNNVYVLLGGLWATTVAGFIALYLTN